MSEQSQSQDLYGQLPIQPPFNWERVTNAMREMIDAGARPVSYKDAPAEWRQAHANWVNRMTLLCAQTAIGIGAIDRVAINRAIEDAVIHIHRGLVLLAVWELSAVNDGEGYHVPPTMAPLDAIDKIKRLHSDIFGMVKYSAMVDATGLHGTTPTVIFARLYRQQLIRFYEIRDLLEHLPYLRHHALPEDPKGKNVHD